MVFKVVYSVDRSKLFILDAVNSYSKEATNRTPAVMLDPDSGELALGGRSLLENAISFYEPIFDWSREYCQNPQAETVIKLSFEYINSDSLKCLYLFLKIFEEELSSDVVRVQWCYEEGDDDMLKTGETYDQGLKMAFNFVEVEEI